MGASKNLCVCVVHTHHQRDRFGRDRFGSALFHAHGARPFPPAQLRARSGESRKVRVKNLLHPSETSFRRVPRRCVQATSQPEAISERTEAARAMLIG